MSFFAHPTAVIDEGATVGEGMRIWHFTHVESTATIGEGCSLGQNVYVGTHVRIGNCCKLQNNVSLYDGITLGDDVFCGPSCVFTNDPIPRALFPKGRELFVPTLVQDGASIGANATIVCGHTIGRCAMIGAGAVVTTDVSGHMLMAGIPVRQAGLVCACGARLAQELRCATTLSRRCFETHRIGAVIPTITAAETHRKRSLH